MGCVISYSRPRGFFPTQGSNPADQNLYLLPWQADSSPLCHLGSPHVSNSYNQLSTHTQKVQQINRKKMNRKKRDICASKRAYQKALNFISHSVQFTCSVVSNSLWPHEPQHARPPCPSPTPRVYSNSCPSSWWCHPAISSSVIPFTSCSQSLPASGSFPMGQLFAWGGQSTRASASASVLPVNTQDWSPLGWTGWISLQSKGLSRVFSNTVLKHLFFGTQLSSQSNSHIHTWPLEKS